MLSKTMRIESYLLFALSASMVIPLVLAFAYGENGSVVAFAKSAGTCASIGLACYVFSKPIKSELKLRNKFFLVAFSFLLASLAGSLPFIYSGTLPSFADALFESCSGFTTTGASAIADLSAVSQSVLFWRAFTQWLGGLGVLLFVVTLLPVSATNGQHFPFYKVYFVLTAAEIVLLKLGGLSFFDAITHTFSTVSTGGFSAYNDSAAHFGIFAQIVILLFMLLAGTNFGLYIVARRRGFSSIKNNEELKFYLVIIGLVSALVFMAVSLYDGFANIGRGLIDSVFQVVSVISTTGFTTADYGMWPTFAQMLILCLFFFGGCSSSCAGGVKCVRIVVCLKLIKRSVSLRIHPNRIAPLMLDDTEMPTESVIKITGFVLTYIAVIFGGTLLLSINNLDFVSSFSAAASCLGNIGIGIAGSAGAGSIGAGSAVGFATFSAFSKLVCAFLMIVGRLEIFTVFILFSKYYRNPNYTR